jgi:hypothetical protein
MQPRADGIFPEAEGEMADYAWSLVADSGHLPCEGWQYDDETGRLTCACGVVLFIAPKGRVVGPLQAVRYANGPTEWHDLPRSTLDIRYAACGNHHLACDCREALLAEDIAEYRGMFRQAEQAILAAIEGHQTYAYTGSSDTGWSSADDFGQCKCPACAIARAAHIGFSECMQQRLAASKRLEAEARERDRAYFTALYPNLNEVPF